MAAHACTMRRVDPALLLHAGACAEHWVARWRSQHAAPVGVDNKGGCHGSTCQACASIKAQQQAHLPLLRGHALPDRRVAGQLAEQAHDRVRARVVPRKQQRQAQVLPQT